MKLAALAAAPLGVALMVIGGLHLSSPWTAPTELTVTIFEFVFRSAWVLMAVVLATLTVAFVLNARDEPGGDPL